jgi:hypothetical protein
MRTHTSRISAGDRRKAADRQIFGLYHGAERRAADSHDRRLAAQTERVGGSFIVVTCFD